MTPEETRILLGEIAVIDNRKMSTETAQAWHQLLAGFSLDDCRKALAAFRRNRPDEWVVPGHLVQIMNRAPSLAGIPRCPHEIPLGSYCHDCRHGPGCHLCLHVATNEDPDW